MKKRPNILFLFADDMRYSTINALGTPQIITPNLDELVHNGTSFINAHIPGGSQAAVCQPSRAMLNSGRFLFHLDQLGARIPEEHTCLGETLLSGGYNCFGTGKWHNCYQSFARSFNDGAEIFFGGMYDHWKVPVYHFDPTGRYPNVVNDVMDPGYDNFMVPRRCDHSNLGVHSTDLFSDAACDYIRNYKDDKPFYMYVAYMAPHDPRSMPQEFLDMYDLDSIELPPNFMKEHPFDFGVSQVRDEVLAKVPRDENEIKRHIRDYYAMITHIDSNIGKIINALKETGQYENTIILFSADNGLAVGQHGLMGKQNNYEHSIKVPFIISGPSIPKGEIRDSYIYLMDIFPTLCDYAQVPIPESVEGISFKSAIEDGSKRTRDLLYAAYADKIRSIKDYKYKLIEYKCADMRKTQLFDLENDPWEMNDLSGLEEMQPEIHRLRKLMKEYAVKSDDIKTDEGKRFWTEYLRVEPDEWGF